MTFMFFKVFMTFFLGRVYCETSTLQIVPGQAGESREVRAGWSSGADRLAAYRRRLTSTRICVWTAESVVRQRPASPSVSSIRVPAGSSRKAIFSPMRGTSRNGDSKVTPSAASFLQNASSPFTSNPM